MGGLFGIGGSSYKTNRKFQLTGMQDLSNLFNFALPAGESTFNQGAADTGTAGSYWRGILSGNRAALDASVAPERNAALAASDATKRQAATMGTARGGGVAGANRTIGDQTRAAIDNALLGARGKAAEALGRTGSTELSAALNALGLGESAASDTARAGSEKPATAPLISQWSNLFTNILGGPFKGTGI